MQADELMRTMARIWAEDADMHAWCMETFDNPLSVFIGINEDKPPASDQYPVLAIAGVTRRSGSGDTLEAWEIDVGAGVVDSGVDVFGPITIFSGMIHAEQLIHMAMDALKSAKMGKWIFNGEYSQVNFDGVFVSYDTMRLERPASRRRI